MADLKQSPYLIRTGEGIFADVEVNLIDIVRRAVESNPEVYSRLGAFDYYRIDSDALSSVDVPAFYIWTDGSDETSDSAGGMRGDYVHTKESIYTTIRFLHGGSDMLTLAKDIKWFGNIVKEAVFSNLNLNDLMNQKAEVKGIDFLPRPIQTGGSVVIAQGFTIPVIYKRTTRSKQSQR